MNTSRRHFLKTTAALPLPASSLSAAPPNQRVRIGQIGTQHGHAAGKMETLRRSSEHDGELTAFAAAIRGGPPLPWNAARDIAVSETVLLASGADQ